MADQEILQINKEQFNALLEQYNKQFRPDQYGQPRTNPRNQTSQMGKWLENMLGVFPGLTLPKDRSILQNPSYTEFDGYSPVTEFFLMAGKDPKQDYVRGHIRMPYENQPDSGVELSLERSAKGQRVIGTFSFSSEGDLTSGNIMSHLITEGKTSTYSFIKFNGSGVIDNVQHRMGQIVQLGDRLAVPKILNELSTGVNFGKIPSDVNMMKVAKIG